MQTEIWQQRISIHSHFYLLEFAMKLVIDSHPLLDLQAFVTEFPAPLGELVSTNELMELLSLDATAPMKSDEDVRLAVRDLLRHGGFKPTGRSKPASEYLEELDLSPVWERNKKARRELSPGVE